MIDEGRDAVVGGAQQPAAVLQCPGLGDLQVLQGADAAPEPGVVGDGQDQVGFGGGGPRQVGVGNLVANGHRCPVFAHGERLLVPRPWRGPGHGQVKELDQAAQDVLEGNVVAEWHQAPLDVTAAALADGDGRVLESVVPIPIRFDAGNAQHQAGAGGLAPLVPTLQPRCRFMFKQGDCGLRPEDQVPAPVGFGQVKVAVNDGHSVVAIPLHRLIDVALHQRGGARCFWFDPLCPGQGETNQPRGGGDGGGPGAHAGKGLAE